MTKFVDYDIVTGTLEFDLVDKVRKKIKQGWIPVGGVVVTKTRVMQALILPADAQ